MTNKSGPARDDPHDLLSATRDLTRRVRLAQRGAWFPLLVFSVVTLAAIPFNRYGRHPTHCSPTQGGGYVCTVYSALALWYWPVALLVAYVAISGFYLRRSRERGVGTRVRPYVAVGVVLTLLTTVWALWADAHPAFLADSRFLRPGEAANHLLYRMAAPAGAIGLALLLLAWIERSWPLFTLTVAYLVVVIAGVGIGWFTHPTPWAPLPHLAVDGGVLLVGGILLAVTERAQGPSSA